MNSGHQPSLCGMGVLSGLSPTGTGVLSIVREGCGPLYPNKFIRFLGPAAGEALPNDARLHSTSRWKASGFSRAHISELVSDGLALHSADRRSCDPAGGPGGWRASSST